MCDMSKKRYSHNNTLSNRLKAFQELFVGRQAVGRHANYHSWKPI